MKKRVIAMNHLSRNILTLITIIAGISGYISGCSGKNTSKQINPSISDTSKGSDTTKNNDTSNNNDTGKKDSEVLDSATNSGDTMDTEMIDTNKNDSASQDTGSDSQPAGKTIWAAKVLELPDNNEIVQMVKEWKNLKITDAFAKDDLFAKEVFRNEINKTDIKSWLIAQVFFWDNNNLYTDHKEDMSILENGKVAKPEIKQGWEDWYNWLEMASPSNSSYKKRTIDRIVSQVKEFNPDGLSLDFIRYFVFWELTAPGTDPASIPDACFSKESISDFKSYAGITIPDFNTTQELADFIHKNYQQKWTQFKCAQITKMITDIISAVKQIKPDISINVHIVPWRGSDFNNGLKRIAGQDIAAISQIVDMLSPMTYAKMTGNSATWINRVTADIAAHRKKNIPVVPAIAAEPMYNTGEISDEEFEQYVINALKAPSAGITFWPWEAITQSQKEIIKKYIP